MYNTQSLGSIWPAYKWIFWKSSEKMCKNHWFLWVKMRMPLFVIWLILRFILERFLRSSDCFWGCFWVVLSCVRLVFELFWVRLIYFELCWFVVWASSIYFKLFRIILNWKTGIFNSPDFNVLLRFYFNKHSDQLHMSSKNKFFN